MALNCQKHPSKYLLRMRKNAENRTIRINFYDGRKFQRLQTYKREVVFSCIYVRGALATDARGCSLWRSLLERPPPVPGFETRSEQERVRMVWTRGGYIYIKIFVFCLLFIYSLFVYYKIFVLYIYIYIYIYI